MLRQLFLLLLLLSATVYGDNADEQLREAYRSYAQGERAQTVAERSEAFNRALAAYGELAERYAHPKLFFNVGNCYFQLDEPAWAILYYEKALKYAPREEKMARNLYVARTKAGINGESDSAVKRNLLFFHYRLAEAEKITLLSLFTILSVILLSIMIWAPDLIPNALRNIVVGLTLLFLGSLMWNQYLAPVEGILVRASALHRDAGDHYASVIEQPLPAGEKVLVQEVIKEGFWLRVKTRKGSIGFVSHEAIRII